jgi:hypothetical protein
MLGMAVALGPAKIGETFTLYWMTNTAVSAARFYWELHFSFTTPLTSLPLRPCASFRVKTTKPRDVGQSGHITSSSISTSSKKGGHYAAWEQPKLFSEEVRAGFRSLRA